MISDRITWALQGSLYDLINADVPNFGRSSAMWLEKYLNDSLCLESVAAHFPSIDTTDSAIILEPAGINLVTYNQDLSQPVWIKGSNCQVAQEKVQSADTSTFQARKIVWSTGDGLTQSLNRTIYLQAGLPYTMTAILRLPNGEHPGDKDVLRLVSGVSGTPTIALSQLVSYPNRYRIMQVGFTTTGKQLELPKYSHDTGYALTAVSGSTASFTVPDTITADQFTGGMVQFGQNQKLYSILGSTASGVTGSVTITTDSTNLAADAIAVGMQARLHGAPDQAVEIEFYVESSLTLHFDSIQIEQSPFRTSQIYQDSALKVRAASQLTFRHSPFSLLKTLGVFLELKEWRGDGNLFNTVNLSATIATGQLVVTADSNVLTVNGTLPQNCSIFIQVSQENNNVSVYVNNVLQARANAYNFVGDHHSSLDFTSDGLRSFYQFLVFDRLLLDGQPAIGQPAIQDVAELFSSSVIIDSVAIAANSPAIVMPRVTVPPPIPPIFKSQIQGLNTASNTLTVADGSGFTQGAPVAVVRNNRPILRSRIVVKNGNAIQLEVLYGVVFGDFLVYGNVDQPGRTSRRYPYTPIDEQVITAIQPAPLNRLSISSTLSYTRQRAFIESTLNEDIAEVLILDKDDQNGYLFVNDVTNIQVGHIISQPSDELIIEPDCCDVYLLEQVDGVEIESKYLNGLTLINRNPVPVQVQPVLRPAAY